MTGDVHTAATMPSSGSVRVEPFEPSGHIGRYALLRPLGRGGMGVVYLARDELLGRHVAVKLLDRRGTPGLQARLLQEAQALARLSHPNVVAIYEAGEHDGRIYLAMERITGDTLGAWRSERLRGLVEILEVALQVARGLAAAHDAGLVHRDVKPDNIMIGDDGRARVMDFGLARAARSRADDDAIDAWTDRPRTPTPLTGQGVVIGTPGYMAPEQRRGGVVDASGDIFSFCVVLYEMLAGARLPVDLTALPVVLTRCQTPRWLVELVVRGLRDDPAARWPTMHALIAELEAGLRPPVRRAVVRVATVAVLLAVSWVAAWQAHVVIAQHQRSRFDAEVRRIESAIQQRMTAYVQVLRGGLGLFQVAGAGDADRWIRYVSTLQLGERYPGFKALSFAAAVAPDDLPGFIRKIRSGPLPAGIADPQLIRQFTVRSPVKATSAPPIHSPIIFVAPMIRENERVLGVDMMQEPGRRAAMERAAEVDAAVLSPRVNLAGQGDLKAGFIAYLGVRRDGALLGWLTAAFRAHDFMRGLLGDGPPALDFEVYDGTTLGPEALLYSTDGVADTGAPLPLADAVAALDHVGEVELAGRTWTLRYRATPAFSPRTDQLAPWSIVVSGLFAAILFHMMSRPGEPLARPRAGGRGTAGPAGGERRPRDRGRRVAPVDDPDGRGPAST